MQVYIIFNSITGKCYVGQTVQRVPDRIRQHRECAASDVKRPRQAISQAIHKHGWAAFSFAILETCKTQQELNDAERFWIDRYDSLAPSGYNLTDGGKSSGHLSDEVRRKISNATKGRTLSESHILKMRGRKHPPRSESAIAKLSEAAKLRTHSESTKLKMSQAQRARERKPCSEETKRKIRETMRRKALISAQAALESSTGPAPRPLQ